MRISIFTMSLLAALASQAAEPQLGTGDGDGYTLVWQDLFDGEQLNRDRWNVEIVSNPANNELQYYIDDERTVRVGDDGKGNGCLILTANREEYKNRHFTSGRVNSKHKVEFTHGKIEAAIKLPKTANGLWPAFWMMGNYDEVGWPRCGETDIMEFGNATGIRNKTQDRYFNGACHWGYYNDQWQYPNYANSVTWDYSLQDDEFHLFTCIWDDEMISMYCDRDRFPDREPYYSIGIKAAESYPEPTWDTGEYFHKPNFILFNLAVGGHFPNITDAAKITALNDENDQTASMYVNYVKVYQRDNNITAPDNGDEQPEDNGDDNEGQDGIDSIAASTEFPAEYFNLQGIRVAAPQAGAILIERRGSESRVVRF